MDDYQLKLFFDNNEIKISDLKPYLDKGVFQESNDKNYFKLIKNKEYCIEWPHEQDLNSDTLFLEGIKVLSVV